MNFVFINKKRICLYSLFVISSITSFIIPIFRFNENFIARDWTLYNIYSHFTKSCLLYYKSIPLHYPYFMGGIDVFASPQSKVLSPLSLVDLVFSSPIANLVSLILLSIVGSYGIYKLLLHLNISPLISVICAIIFSHSSWFALHFSEGHITFGSFQLFGLLLYYILQINKGKFKIYIAILLGFMLLNGEMYPFIYSILLVFFSLLFKLNGTSIFSLIKSVKSTLRDSILASIIFIGLASVKLIPVLLTHGTRTPIKENISLDFTSLIHAFFNPFVYVNSNFPSTSFSNFGIRFHEIGVYIGVLSFILIIIGLIKNSTKKIIPILLITVLFLWIGTGFCSSINPWKIFQLTPIINNAHIQTRALFIVYLMCLILLAYSLNYLSKHLSKWKLYSILIVLVVEAMFAGSYPYYKIYQTNSGISNSKVYKTFLSNTTINKTVATPSNQWGFDFELLEQKNVASKGFIDNALKMGDIKTIVDTNYKGEVYFLKGNGSLNLKSYTPKGITVSLNVTKPSIIQFNTNYLNGWKSDCDKVNIYNENGLLTISSHQLNETITLKYKPNYLIYIFIIYGFTLLLIGIYFVFLR